MPKIGIHVIVGRLKQRAWVVKQLVYAMFAQADLVDVKSLSPNSFAGRFAPTKIDNFDLLYRQEKAHYSIVSTWMDKELCTMT
jgi:hypothetical protein